MDILNMLGLGGPQTQQASQQLGLAPNQMSSALEAAVPLLLGKLTQNATSPEQAQALAAAVQQHDGSAIDAFQSGQLPDLSEGQGIVRHVFGGQEESAAAAIAQRAGISPQMAMSILAMAAPLVMGYLGRNANSGNNNGGLGGLGGALGGLLGGGGLGSVLGSVLGGGAAGGLGGMLGNVLGGAMGGEQSQPQYQQPQYQQPQEQYQQQDTSGGLGSVLGSVLGGGAAGGLGGILGNVLGGAMGGEQSQPQYQQPQYQQPQEQYQQQDPSGDLSSGVGLNPIGQQEQAQQGGGMFGAVNDVLGGNHGALDDLIGMFGGGQK